MKNNKILLLPAALLLFVLFFYFKNYFFTKRSFVVYHSPKFDICFMVDENYKIDEITETTMRYSGKKNKGKLEILKRELDPKIKKQEINGFSAGYLKEKNLRIFEYKLNDEFILRDEFLFASKMPLNLVPYRTQCSEIFKHYKDIKTIFNI